MMTEDFCGYPDKTEFNDYGGVCDEEHCKNRYKFKWELFHLNCKYRNRDYGPPSGIGKP